MSKTLGLLFVATTALLLCDSDRAEACGGCFVPPSESTVVTDHRMALSISRQQTVLWDQIRYTGDPDEFAWVLPIRAGARIEVANDEFFTALDAASQPTVYAPQDFGGAAGCGLTGCAYSADSAIGLGGKGGVEVLSQAVVGPYEQVTLRATDDDALTSWLRKNDFQIPASIEPTIAAYVRDGFDFIALKLRPVCGERSMRPVRVVTPGADPTLPLRMVAAGVGARVGIILYVISEGRYEPQNFPSALIDDDQLRWDRFANRSNYEELSQEIMARGNGRTWITEYADKPKIPLVGTGFQAPRGSFGPFGNRPGLSDAYYSQCKSYRERLAGPTNASSSSGSSSGGVQYTPCPQADAGSSQTQTSLDAGEDGDGGPGVDAGDAIADAGDDAADAGSREDAGTSTLDGGGEVGGDETYSDAGSNRPIDPPTKPTGDLKLDCAYLDDLDVALTGLHREDVWVTRLRSVLPADALKDGDLRLEPSKLADGRANLTPVSNLHWTPYYADEDRPAPVDKTSCEGAPKRHRKYGSWVFAVSAAVFGVSWLRRRRRPLRRDGGRD